MLRIDLAGDWKVYAGEIDGLQLLGTVRMGTRDVGAFAKAPASGRYFMINAAHVRELDGALIKPLIELAQARRAIHRRVGHRIE